MLVEIILIGELLIKNFVKNKNEVFENIDSSFWSNHSLKLLMQWAFLLRRKGCGKVLSRFGSQE